MAQTTWDRDDTSLVELAMSLKPGDYVQIDGYGGYAEVINVFEDGYSPSGTPKYRTTVKWGPHNPNAGRARYHGIEDFAMGKVRPSIEADEASSDARMAAIDDTDDIAALMARLAELNSITNK